MQFEIMNPHDYYTMEAPSLLLAAVAACVLGEGRLGLKQIDAEPDVEPAEMPVFLFGGSEEWFADKFGCTFAHALETCTSAKVMPDLIKTLDSVLIGDRNEFNRIWEEEASKIKKWDQYRADWIDEHKSSLADMSAIAWDMAAHLRKRLANGQVE